MMLLVLRVSLLAMLAGACAGTSPPPAPEDYASQRTRMVEWDVAPRGITDASVLAALRTVPRHEFVPGDMKPYAYADSPLPIGHDQTISQPYIVALMTQALVLSGTERVLEIGTGSGYQAAVLGEIVAEVFTIEIVTPLGERARETLSRLGYKGVHVKIGDGYQGWPEHAPFDAIIVTAAPEKIPQPLLDQLAVGGMLVIPLGPEGGLQRLKRITKTATGVREEVLEYVRFVPMTGEARKSHE